MVPKYGVSMVSVLGIVVLQERNCNYALGYRDGPIFEAIVVL